MSDGDRPARDRVRTGLRLGCGGLLGLLLGAACGFGLAEGDELTWVLVTLGFVVLCSAAAWRYGERFWNRVGDLLAWLPWP